MMKFHLLVPFTALSVFAVATSGGAENLKITDFDPEENAQLGWKVVDDGVMGGLSKGKVDFTAAGILRFNGNLSLENNGGFSSLRTDDIELDLGEYAGLVMRVKGDGRAYQVRIASDALHRGMEVSFMAEFATENGEWIEVKVPFEALVGSWRGTTLNEKVFNPAKVSRLGLILADKKAGDFALEVDWIHAYAADEQARTATIIDVALADGRFKTLVAGLTEGALAGALQEDGPLTVFAPTDEAFANLPEGTVESLLKAENRGQLQAILKYHVVAGEVSLAGAFEAGTASTLQGEAVSITFADGRVRVNESAILDADLKASNGIIHVIDAVLIPPTPAGPEQGTDILGVAKSAGKFNALLAAVTAAGLDSVLAGEGPFTVFAPSDEAFVKLPEGTIDMLLEPENLSQLKALLTYHVVAGKVSAGDALNAKSAKALNGESLAFSLDDGRFQVNNATVRAADIACDNGVIHVIDGILSPPTEQEKPEASDPAVLIKEAINRGVPVFNDGDHAKCAQIYRDCLEVLADDMRLEPDVRTMLKEVLTSTGEGHGDRDQAWLYRRALDLTHHALSE